MCAPKKRTHHKRRTFTFLSSFLDGCSWPPWPASWPLSAEAYIGIFSLRPWTFNDTAGVAAARALNPGVLRYPGGTLSNLWDPKKGQYVEPSPFPTGYPNGYVKWDTWAKGVNGFPEGTFSAEMYLLRTTN